jgi:hypothetical protein
LLTVLLLKTDELEYNLSIVDVDVDIGVADFSVE